MLHVLSFDKQLHSPHVLDIFMNNIILTTIIERRHFIHKHTGSCSVFMYNLNRILIHLSTKKDEILA